MDYLPRGEGAGPRHGAAWQELAGLEPELQELLRAARRAGSGSRSWLEAELAFTALKHELAELLGAWGRHRHHPVLGGAVAYAVAYWKLYQALVARVGACPGDPAPCGPTHDPRSAGTTPGS
jgi:hypothetical protein